MHISRNGTHSKRVIDILRNPEVQEEIRQMNEELRSHRESVGVDVTCSPIVACKHHTGFTSSIPGGFWRGRRSVFCCWDCFKIIDTETGAEV